jgi:LmbE family N-acetylglucosaminyl deacetylase
MPTKLAPEIITAAILGFEEQKRHIDGQIAELRAILSGGSAETAATPEPPKGKRRKMSAAGRKAIAEAQRKRWAASRGVAEASAPKETRKPKRKLSAAGKANIVAALKKRWAAKKAAAKKAKPAVAKRAVVEKVAKRKGVPVKKTKSATKAAPAPGSAVTNAGE